MVETVLSFHQYGTDDSSDIPGYTETPSSTSKYSKTVPPLRFHKPSSQQELSQGNSSARRNNDNVISTPKSSSRDRYMKNTPSNDAAKILPSPNKNSSSRSLKNLSGIDDNNSKDVSSTPSKLNHSRKQSLASLRQLETSLSNKALEKPNNTPRSSRISSTSAQQTGKPSSFHNTVNLPPVINNSKISASNNNQQNSVIRSSSSKRVSSKSSNFNTYTPQSSSSTTSSSSNNSLGQLVKPAIPYSANSNDATSPSNLSTNNNISVNNNSENSKGLNFSLNLKNVIPVIPLTLPDKTTTVIDKSILTNNVSQRTPKQKSENNKIDSNVQTQKSTSNETPTVLSSRKELSNVVVAKSSSLPNSSRRKKGNSSQQKSPLGTNIILLSHDFGLEMDYSNRSNEMDNVEEEDGSPDDSSIEVLTVRSAVEDVFHKTHSNSQTPRLGKQGSQSSLQGSNSSSRSKQSNASSYDHEDDVRTFSEKELRILQQSFSKKSENNHVANTNDEDHEQCSFWEQVEIDHFSLLSDSERMYTLFSMWIQEEQEEEIKEVYKLQYFDERMEEKGNFEFPHFQTYLRDELSKLKKASSIIYEEAFVQVVDYFISLIAPRHDQFSTSTRVNNLLFVWQEFISLEFFDYLDIKRIGSISKESVFMILCLISAQCKRNLCLFLEIFGETIFELCRSSSNSSTSRNLKRSSAQQKVTSVHEARKLSFMCGIDDIQFTKALIRYNYQDLEWLDLEMFLKVYRHIFQKFDKGTLLEKEYFVPPMISPSTDRTTAPPISARKAVGGSSESASSNRSGFHHINAVAIASTTNTGSTNSNNNSAHHQSFEGSVTALHMDINSSSSVVIETSSLLSEMSHPHPNSISPSSQEVFNKAQSTQQQPAGSSSFVQNALALLASSSVTPLSETPHHQEMDENNVYNPPSSGRTPKQIYSSSKKIAFPLRGLSQTQLVDTLAESSHHQNKATSITNSTHNHGKPFPSKQDETPYFIEEESTKKQVPFVSDDKFLEETKEKVFMPAHHHHNSEKHECSNSKSSGKHNKYLVNAMDGGDLSQSGRHMKAKISSSSTNHEKKDSSRKKRWKCCIM
ncbi:hypothetical protein FDP41_003346 [Naegleria fowleri]|uniref:Uncharacterized protein n=1 Tax=Naegleria fowleri TaxID=5763 RepID=A0A6A5BT14_NAEFO|nr:uncharacterized protein FDP41_003346 [Naegleria fowleri]KAF0977354.1 hypothetical protein FDP41_003346 [Naegleria fowleri]